RARGQSRAPRATHSCCLRSRRTTRRYGLVAPGGCPRGSDSPSRPSNDAPRSGMRPPPSSGASQDPFRAARHRVPDREGLSERHATAVREPIVLPRHAARRLLPAARDEASLLEPPQRRVQGPLLEIEEPVRPVLQLVPDLEPVLLLLRDERAQAELERSILHLYCPAEGE